MKKENIVASQIDIEKQAEMEKLIEQIINKIQTASYRDLRIYYYFVCGDRPN